MIIQRKEFISDTMKKLTQLLRITISIGFAVLAVIAMLAGLKVISVQAANTKIGVVFDGPINDAGVKWSSYQGLLRAEDELGVLGTVYTASGDLELSVQQCALNENELCIGVGFQFTDAIWNTAASYTMTKFAILDAAYETYPPNLRGIVFASEEVGYLAGTLAGLMTESDVIGDLGGMEIPPVTAFTLGYQSGAECANPAVTTIISYTNDFGAPFLGAQYAQSMISQGADVIFAPAGQTGAGAILTATQSGVWAIGVDTDQYYSVFMSGTITGSNYLLSSAMKRMDNAVFYTIADVVAGTFTSGTETYDLSVNGVGLAPFHETEPSIPAAVQAKLDWVKLAIISGAIDPYGPCPVIYQNYLPFTER